MTDVVSRLPKGIARRRAIIDAAITVIAEQGLEALSHRTVAAAADVPVAATTYYFGSLDELRTVALNEIVRQDLDLMTATFEDLSPTSELGEILGEMVWDWLQNREASVVSLETMASAMRRESVREIARGWEGAWVAVLEPRIGRVRALVAVCTAFGYIRRSLLQDGPYSHDEMIAVMRTALGETVEASSSSAESTTIAANASVLRKYGSGSLAAASSRAQSVVTVSSNA